MIDLEGFVPPKPERKIVDYSPELERAVKARAEFRRLTEKKEFSTGVLVNSADDIDIITIKIIINY